MADEIPLFELNMDQAEEEALLATLRTKWISTGPKTEELEERFSQHIGVPHAVAVSNCTAALHLALLTCNVGPGDEVIVPSMTFVATANAVRYTGAKVVFADIESLHRPLISEASIRKNISSKTKAIIVVHYAGYGCKMDAVMNVAQQHNLFVIEDCAHSPFSSYQGQKLGSFGDVSCFSFFSNKNITCAEGGMFMTSDPEKAKRARLLRGHGMTTLSYERAKGHASSYDVIELGFNYRLDDLRASLLLAQLDKLRRDVERRSELRRLYTEGLKNQESLILPFIGDTELSSNYIFPVVLGESAKRSRDEIREKLKKSGVATSVHYPPVHQFGIYRSEEHGLPITENYGKRTVTLPMFHGMTKAQVNRVCKTLLEVLE